MKSAYTSSICIHYAKSKVLQLTHTFPGGLKEDVGGLDSYGKSLPYLTCASHVLTGHRMGKCAEVFEHCG